MRVTSIALTIAALVPVGCRGTPHPWDSREVARSWSEPVEVETVSGDSPRLARLSLGGRREPWPWFGDSADPWQQESETADEGAAGDEAAVTADDAQGGTSDADLKQANNPLADFTALNFQNYYAPTLSGLPDATANTFWVRYVKPLGRWLMRASVPLATVPTGPITSESGLGDLNVFAAYVLSNPGSPTTYGIGPLLVAPTASDDALGSGKWQAGAAAVYFDASSSLIQWGGLLTYQTDVGGDSSRSSTSLMIVQPFGFFQLGGGTYLRSSPLWTFDFETGDYNIPIGMGLGKVVRADKTVFNFFIEPQVSILHEGVGQPEFQIFVGLNTQFK